MASSAQPSLHPVIREMAAASCAMTLTSVVFNPFDVVKTKLQTQNQLSRDASQRLYNGALHCIRRVCAEDGFVRGLWLPGLTASVLRDIMNGGIRMGLYPAAVRSVHEVVPWGKATGDPPTFGTRVLAGLLTGFSGALLANPTDVVKVRLQAESGTVAGGVYITGLYQGKVPSPNTFRCMWELAQGPSGPVQGLLRGVGPNCARAALVTSGQMSSYDQSKRVLSELNMWPFDREGPRIAVASFISGLSAATVAAPVDLVRSRVMDDARDSHKPSAYRSGLNCACKTVRAEGPFALWKGWVPSYLRLGPHFMVSLPLLELLRTQVFGLRPL